MLGLGGPLDFWWMIYWTKYYVSCSKCRRRQAAPALAVGDPFTCLLLAPLTQHALHLPKASRQTQTKGKIILHVLCSIHLLEDFWPSLLDWLFWYQINPFPPGLENVKVQATILGFWFEVEQNLVKFAKWQGGWGVVGTVGGWDDGASNGVWPPTLPTLQFQQRILHRVTFSSFGWILLSCWHWWQHWW